MSADKRSFQPSGRLAPKERSGYTPRSVHLTATEFQDLIRQLIAEKPLITVAIILAGVGGAAELSHVAWLAARFLLGR
jgi:hypothetical protein